MNMLWLKTLLFTLIAPGALVGLFPYLWLGSRLRQYSFTWSLVSGWGLLVLAAGIGIYIWCVADFIQKGRGTPAPYDPPKMLVHNGLYRFVRNPMYLGVLSIIVAESLLFRVFTLLLYAAIVFLAFHLRVLWYEEPTLRRLFGEAYAQYCASVPRWLPRVPSGQHPRS